MSEPPVSPAEPARIAPEEAARLAEAFRLFNAASAELTEAYGALEKQVASLTEELAQANGELRRQYEEKARLTDRLSTLLNQLPAGVVVVDGNGVIEEANPAALDMVGARPGAGWGASAARLLPADAPAEWDCTGENGQPRRLSMNEAALAGGNARIVLLHDMTRQHALKIAAARNERLAAMGEMAASLAHQLRTPLAAATLYVGTLLSREMAPADVKSIASRAQDRLRHLERLIRDTLMFARGEVLGREAIDVAALVDELQHTVEPVARQAGVTLTVTPPSAGTVSGDRKAVASALVSLLENAVQACVGGGEVGLSVDFAGNEVGFVVRDNGRGIPREIQERLFEPFFTTREDGTGLGLAIARGVARVHGGDIECESAPGAGSRFTLRLPVQTPEEVVLENGQ
ncbi:Sensor protein [Methyloversatilis universalis FAM5]|uniref:histidine kinase n=1 Tax=Methyloversatilis universalis (strain ATCC BAA-1314 / DSM 25237 / JCM 13912 / CCUG 52030 / FAM5) TaxID=1000565 RepID=F5R7U4_METUF|nr:HAMP domain-containing sensor histidine kinase [Methyloversatilis universalis]EGK73155.1 Sensor protein [Methyloversatilis universalis FAM5]